ncbi:hypothetical protein AVEN_9708-1 [Araneus ventricosus]|uniref:Uncharacterized protein n=1 Tax=Araneus ventricosus TaxID=182803 RepID=A0A4Y2DVT8_ARAVE|nr:hypothetical protein AVEN_9708-1 [Araneus ventricosus]
MNHWGYRLELSPNLTFYPQNFHSSLNSIEVLFSRDSPSIRCRPLPLTTSKPFLYTRPQRHSMYEGPTAFPNFPLSLRLNCPQLSFSSQFSEKKRNS